MDMPRIIERGARNWGDKVALISGDRKFTFREVDERSNELANGLLSLGCSSGSHIGIMLSNSHQFIEMYFAKLKIGASWTALNLRLNDEELTWQINDSETDTLLVGQESLERITAIRPGLKNLKHYIAVAGDADGFINYEELISGSGSERPILEFEQGGLSRIGYTGGTTGRPKGIAITRESDQAVMRNLLLDNVPDLDRSDVFMGLQPLYHAVWTYILPCWIRGATQVVTMDWSPSAALETIKRERVTIIKTVPTVLMRLLDYPGIEDYDLSSLRTIIYGGSPMPLERLKKGIGLLGQVFVQSYGQAEAPMTIATLSKEDHVVFGTQEEVNRLASVGRPYTLVDVRVVDDDGDDVPLGELGEVIVSGDHIMKEYWHQRPEVTAETVKDGWVHTRDIGRLDENGYLYLIDRKSEMIITGGLNVYPAEVEQVLYSHPAVEIAAAIGVPDEEWGESIRVFIVLKPGILASEAELLEFCKQNMSSYKKPKSIEIRDSLPMSGAGKVARRELREAYWRGRQRAI